MKSIYVLGFTVLISAPLFAQPQESTIGIAPPAPPSPAREEPILWKPVRGTDGKPLALQTSGDFKVELRAGAWAHGRVPSSSNRRET